MAEIIDSAELAKRWGLPESWIRSKTRPRTPTGEQIPHFKFGRYIRFELDSPTLEAWLKAHRAGGNNGR